MSIKRRAAALTGTILKRLDARIGRTAHPDDQPAAAPPVEPVEHGWPPRADPAVVPSGALEYLRFDHPKLVELQQRYRATNHPACDPTLWTDHYQRGGIELPFFRADNAYLWQHRGMGNSEIVTLRYLLTAYYIEKIDTLGLLQRLREDGLFGAYTVPLDDERKVSRDLLDSIAEIYFLERTLGLSGWAGVNILDIGAGYGRLAYRLVDALPHIGKYLCVDAVALSTYLCEYYLRFRGISDKAIVVPLPDIEQALERNPVDIAVNVHSFSECTLRTITWWVRLLAANRVRYVMIVPNDGRELLSREEDGSHLGFRGVLESHGYRLAASQPKYLDSALQRHGVHAAHHYLFDSQ